MTANVGKPDRIFRVLLGLLLIVAPLLNVPGIWSVAAWSYAAMIVGAVLVVTGLTGRCPLYRMFGIDTCGI